MKGMAKASVRPFRANATDALYATVVRAHADLRRAHRYLSLVDQQIHVLHVSFMRTEIHSSSTVGRISPTAVE